MGAYFGMHKKICRGEEGGKCCCQIYYLTSSNGILESGREDEKEDSYKGDSGAEGIKGLILVPTSSCRYSAN